MKPFRIFLFTILLTGCVKSTTWAPRSIQTFDSNGQINARYLFTYDERGYPFTLTKERAIGNASDWQKSYRISYVYDADGKRTSALKEVYDPTRGKWEYFTRMQVHYDRISGLPETEIHQQYQATSESWNNTIKDHYIRNGKGQLLFIVREHWEEDKWENHKKQMFLYNTKGVLIEEKSDTWSKKDQHWMFDTKQTYTYGKNKNAVLNVQESWNVEKENWEKTGKLLYTYDKYGNVVEINHVPVQESTSGNIPLVFFYNHVQHSEGRFPDDFYSFVGSKGTAEYFRKKR